MQPGRSSVQHLKLSYKSDGYWSDHYSKASKPVHNMCPHQRHATQPSCILLHKHFVTSEGIGTCNLQIQEAGMGQGQDSCCDDRLKPRLRRFMAARPPAMPSFTRSLAVAVAAVARAAASLAPNLHRHQQAWCFKPVLITTSHIKYCFNVELQHSQYIFRHLML